LQASHRLRKAARSWEYWLPTPYFPDGQLKTCVRMVSMCPSICLLLRLLVKILQEGLFDHCKIKIIGRRHRFVSFASLRTVASSVTEATLSLAVAVDAAPFNMPLNMPHFTLPSICHSMCHFCSVLQVFTLDGLRPKETKSPQL
jgi:hypothetical protein